MTAAAPARPEVIRIDRHITRAPAAVRLARAAAKRSPTVESRRVAELAQWSLDLVLDRRPAFPGCTGT